MSYEEFKKEIKEQVEEKLGEGYEVRLFPVTKNNGIVLDNLSISRKGAEIAPCIYLQYYYGMILQGACMEQVADDIIGYYNENMPEDFDADEYFSSDKLRSHIVCRLVNTERNRKLLQECPHTSFLNLSVIYYVLFEDTILGSGTVTLRYEHLDKMDLTEEMLMPLACKNMKELLPAAFLTMDDLILELRMKECPDTEAELPDPKEMGGAEPLPLYVLTNSRRSFGAVWMTDPDVLRKIADLLDDDYYILPSSVHECMVLPAALKEDADALVQMVEDINETQVDPEEILADNVYLFSRSQGKLEIAA